METTTDIIKEDNTDCQAWLRKEIAYEWEDKVSLIPKIMFACLVHFVEVEDGLSQLGVDWTEDLKQGHVTQEYIDTRNAVYESLHYAYNYVKTERPQLEKQLDDSYPESTFSEDWVGKTTKIVNGTEFTIMKTCEERFGALYAEVYAETNRLDALIEEKDQVAMSIIVKNVHYLWT